MVKITLYNILFYFSHTITFIVHQFILKCKRIKFMIMIFYYLFYTYNIQNIDIFVRRNLLLYFIIILLYFSLERNLKILFLETKTNTKIDMTTMSFEASLSHNLIEILFFIIDNDYLLNLRSI